MYWIWRKVLPIGFITGLGMTFLGLLAPLPPPLEMVNHFRPYTLFGAVVLPVLTVMSGAYRGAAIAIALALVNAWLFIEPLQGAAKPLRESAAPTFKLVTLNVGGRNTTLDAVADFLLREQADVVLLQETPPRHQQKLLPRLAALYPHVLHCNCRAQVLLSKRPWLDSGSQPMTDHQPPVLWARLSDGRGGSFRIVGLHPAFPFAPWQQARHYDWLIREVPQMTGEPLIVAGDFNMSPWSYRLQKLAASVGLVRHGTWARSWPGHLQVQFVLIDNVLTSPDVRAVSFETGRQVGSDHLPIIATLRLP